MNYKNSSEAFLYTTLTTLIAVFCFDLVYDDSYDAFVLNITAAQFSEKSLLNTHYLAYIGIKDILYLIQNTFPHINVFATFFILSNVLSLFYTIITVNKLILRHHSFILRTIVSLILAAIFLENIVSITHTRFATIFSGMALLNLIAGDQKPKTFIIHGVIFLFGFLMRPEGAIGSILVISIGFIIYQYHLEKIIRGNMLPAFYFIILFSVFTIHKNHTERFEILIEPDIEYALSTGRVVPLSEMDNETDSLRYQMARWGIFIDTTFTHVEFLQSITSEQFIIQPNEILYSFIHISSYYKYYLIFPVFFLILAYILLFYHRDYTLVIKFIVFHLFVFTLMVYLDYNIDVADRHFIVMLTIALLVSMFYALKEKFEVYKIRSIELLVILFVIISAITVTLKNALGNQIQVAQEMSCFEEAMQEIEKVYQNEIIAVTLTAYHLFDQKYTFYNRNYDKNNYIMYDITTYSIVPPYTEYLNKICNCDAADPEAFFKWAAEEEVIFLVTENRYKLIERYMKLKHDKIMKYTPPPDAEKVIKPGCMDDNIFGDYELRMITFD